MRLELIHQEKAYWEIVKNVVWIALAIGFVLGGISGYTIRALTASNSAQEELAKAELQDREQARQSQIKAKENLSRALGR